MSHSRAASELSHSRAALIGAAIAATARIIFGSILIVLAAAYRESEILVLLDVPTSALYFAASRVLDRSLAIVNSADPVFFLVGVSVWAISGGILGLLLSLLSKRTSARGRGPDSPQHNPTQLPRP